MNQNNLNALILVGGMSTRMGQDKSQITYSGVPQIEVLYKMLTELGLDTYLSIRQDQENLNYPTFKDRFLGFGPIGGILTAMTEMPDKAWLVVACDLPLITPENIEDLINLRDQECEATAYFNLERNHFEPLFAIYEPSSYKGLLEVIGERKTCPQKFLYKGKIKKIDLPNHGFLMNVNTPEEMLKAKTILEAQHGN